MASGSRAESVGPAEAPETGQSSKGFDFGLFLRGGVVSGEENGQDTDWNVNWSIS